MCGQVSREKMQSSRTDLLLHPQLEWEVEMLLFAKNQDGGHMLEQCAVFLTVANITRLNSHVVSSEPPDSYVYLKGSFICFFASFFDEIKISQMSWEWEDMLQNQMLERKTKAPLGGC